MQIDLLFFLFPNRFPSEKVAKYLDSIDQDDEGRLGSVQDKRARRTFCFTIHQINQGAAQAGKDGKFQLFVCIGIRYVCDWPSGPLYPWSLALSLTFRFAWWKVGCDTMKDHLFLRGDCGSKKSH